LLCVAHVNLSADGELRFTVLFQQRELLRKEASTQSELVDRLSVPAARRVVVDTGKPVTKDSRPNEERKRADIADSRNDAAAADRGLRVNLSHKQDDAARRSDKPKSDGKKPDELHGKKASRADSDGTASEIPPTPMTPRGPAPQVVIDTGRPAKLAEKPDQPKAVDGSRGRDKLIAVERKIERAPAPGGEDVRKVVVKPRDVGHGAVLKKDAKQKDRVEQRKEVRRQEDVSVRKQEQKVHQAGRQRQDNVNNSAVTVKDSGEKKSHEQRAVRQAGVDENVQTDVNRNKVSIVNYCWIVGKLN
jgi:hypothetical protein